MLKQDLIELIVNKEFNYRRTVIGTPTPWLFHPSEEDTYTPYKSLEHMYLVNNYEDVDRARVHFMTNILPRRDCLVFRYKQPIQVKMTDNTMLLSSRYAEFNSFAEAVKTGEYNWECNLNGWIKEDTSDV